MNLANENISMDFILEMKEAFQLFDKISKVIYSKYNFNNDRSSLFVGSSGRDYGRDLGGHDPGRPSDDMPVLSEQDRKELMNLANENISMDFILEMKEAFQLFDKVSKVIYPKYNFNNNRSSLFGGSSGRGYGRDLGGHDLSRPSDDMPVLSDEIEKSS